MDKASFYLLLSSFASAALACSDEEECPHEVVLATSERDVSTESACQSIGLVYGGMAPYLGLPAQACATLCADAKMNFCRLPQAYMQEYQALNAVDAGPRMCPPAEPRIALVCERRESRGKWHDGCPVAGRRPSGLVSARRRARDAVADYLARAAHLEAASVFAFDNLAEDLANLGAPRALITGCVRAARQEREHARVVGQLARARHACPPAVDVVVVRGRATLLDLALENIVEGVVREAYGAVQANLSGRRAANPELREAMARIAIDEAAHAWLALRIAAWFDAQLREPERKQVAQAKEAAILALRRELDNEPTPSLRGELGLPSRAEARRLLDQLTHKVWNAAA